VYIVVWCSSSNSYVWGSVLKLSTYSVNWCSRRGVLNAINYFYKSSPLFLIGFMMMFSRFMNFGREIRVYSLAFGQEVMCDTLQ
jgi:hypothetical protein